MSTKLSYFPRAFAVLYRDFNYWDVKSIILSLTNICDWPTIPLKDICKIRFDIIADKDITEGRIKLLDRISFDEGRVFSGKRIVTKMVQYRAKPGDIIVSKINARKKAIGIVKGANNIGITIHFRALISDKTQVNTDFLWAALRSQYCTNQFDIETGGMGKGEISEERLLAIQVPFPSLKVQLSIIKRWKKAQDEIAAKNQKIETLKMKIDEHFLVDLALKFEPQSELPKYFSVPWKELFRWGLNYNQHMQTGGDITKGKYPVVELDSLLEVIQYGTSEKANSNGEGVPIIRMNNIIEGELDLSNIKHIKLLRNEIKSLLLQKNDILINRTNSKELVGKCAVFVSENDYVFASYLIRLRLNMDIADPAYVSFAINSQIGRKQINAMSRQIIGQANINTEEIRSINIPLPPLRIQHKIMQQVKEIKIRIDGERNAKEDLSREIEDEVEALILGTKKIEV